MRNLNIKIPGFKSGSKPSRWIGGTLCFIILGGFLYCFSDLCVALAHVAFARSSVSLVIRWIVVSLVLAVSVFGCYVFIDELRHGPRRKRRQKDGQDAYVTPEAAAAIRRGDALERQPFTAARIEFVLAFVQGDTPEQISERVGRVTEIAMSHDGVVHDMVGALVVVAFGTLPASSPTAGSRALLVEHLRRELSNHLKIVHGASDGHYGLIGSGVRISYSFVLPRFDMMLGRLSQLEFGNTEEFGR